MAEAAAQTQRPRAGWRATTAGELASEFLGTFILICFGDGVVAMAVAALNQSGRGEQIFVASGDWLIIGWGWASQSPSPYTWPAASAARTSTRR
jgi:glycerol uptake facilitator protein